MSNKGAAMIAGVILIVGLAWLYAANLHTSVSVDHFAQYVSTRTIGTGADQWLEIVNAEGDWEKTVLVFGYYTDDGAAIECRKIAEALKDANPARDYRCVAANFKSP